LPTIIIIQPSVITLCLISFIIDLCKGKGKARPCTGTGRTAHRGSRGIALLFLDHGTRRVEGSAARPGRSSSPGKTRYPLYRRLGGSLGRFGQVWIISPPPGFDPRTVQPVASRYTGYAPRSTDLCTEDKIISQSI